MITNHTLKLLLTLLMALVLAACNQISKPPTNVVREDAETINTSLETLAQHLAGAVSDVRVRQQIYTGVAARFDGDTNVLYKTLMSEVQSPLRQVLAKTYLQARLSSQSETPGVAALDALANNIPNLQIAVPTHFDTWDVEQYTPLVGYVPAGKDENDIERIKAFNANGDIHWLDAQDLPDKPVIILSQNERTDETGALRPKYLIQEETSATLNPAATTCQHVYVWGVRLVHDYEPWYMGDPEIVLLAYSWTPGLYYHAGFAEVNKENQVYYFNRYLGCTSSHMTFSWYEDDGAWSDRDMYGDVTVYDIYIDGNTTWKPAGSYHLDFATN